MTSTLSQVADAMVTCLNAGRFSLAITAGRQFVPDHALADLKDVVVSVVPMRRRASLPSRSATFFDLTFMVGIQQQCLPSQEERIDALLALGDELILYLRNTRLERCPDAHFVETGDDDPFDPEDLVQRHLFTGVITVTYRIGR